MFFQSSSPAAACQSRVILTVSIVPGDIAEVLLLSDCQKNGAEKRLAQVLCYIDKDRVLLTFNSQIIE